MKLAHLTPDLTATEEYPISFRRLQELYPNRSFPRTMCVETLADLPRVELVAEEARPAVDFGDVLAETAPVKLGDGRWHRQWSVTEADGTVIADLKVELLAIANEIADRKTFKLTPREIMLYMELHRAEAGVPPVTAANYPQLASIMNAHGFNMTETLTAAREQLDVWNARAAVVTLKLEDIKIRIKAASTGAALKILIDELEAFV